MSLGVRVLDHDPDHLAARQCAGDLRLQVLHGERDSVDYRELFERSLCRQAAEQWVCVSSTRLR
jgi:hypothetical protein